MCRVDIFIRLVVKTLGSHLYFVKCVSHVVPYHVEH